MHVKTGTDTSKRHVRLLSMMTVIQVHVPDDEGQRVHQNDDENRDRDNDDNDDVRVVS